MPPVHVPRPEQGRRSAVPSCCVAAVSTALASRSVPSPSTSGGTLPREARKVTRVTPPGAHAPAPPPEKCTLATAPGATALSTDSTLSPGAAPLPGAALALSSAALATALASTRPLRLPSATLKAPPPLQ